MTEHLSNEIIELYRNHRLDDMARRRTNAHLSMCRSCLSRVSGADSEFAVQSLSEALLPLTNDEPFHLSADELESFASGRATHADRIICESHFEVCTECSNGFSRLVTAKSVTPIKPRWQMWSSPTPARIAAAIALLALVVLVIMLWRQQARREEARVVPQQTPATSPSPSPSNTASPSEPTLSAAIALLRDNGREIRLDTSGQLSGAEGFDSETQQVIKSVLSGGSLSKPTVLHELAPGQLTLRGTGSGDQAFRLIGPVSQVVETDRPTLKWQPLKGASSYVVSVYDQNFNRVNQGPPLAKIEWRVTAPLPRGSNFYWEVTATKDGNEVTAPVAPAPKAQFKVLASQHLAELAKLRTQKPASHLALGLAYARFGLLSEAEQELAQLAKENPNSAEVRKLLTQVRRWKS